MDELGLSLMSGVEIDYPSIVEETIQPSNQYFAGGEIMSVGRFKDGIDPRNRGPYTVSVSGKHIRLFGKASK